MLIFLAIFVVEALIMNFLHNIVMPVYFDILVDAGLLTIVILPVLYFAFLRPMVMQYQEAVKARTATETLWRASMDLGRSMDLDKVYQIVLDQVMRLAPYDTASLSLLTSASRLDIEALRSSLPGAHFSKSDHLWLNPEQYKLISQIIREEKSLLLVDTSREPAWVDRPYLFAIRSWVGIPLLVGGKVVGLCELGKVEPNFYKPDQVRLAEALIEQAAISIQNAWLFEQVLAARERLVDLTHQLVEVQENERRYIARELHDEAGQVVVTMMVHLSLLEQNAGDPDAIRQISAEMHESLSSVSSMLHQIATNLRPASLDHAGLEASLRQYLEQVSDQHEMKINLEYEDVGGRMSSEMEIALYRILQESVNNILRHAHATQIDVVLKPRGEQLILMIEDNGVGFDPEAARQSKRLGLFGIRERAEAIGGELVIESAPGKGTTILVEVPYGSPNINR